MLCKTAQLAHLSQLLQVHFFGHVFHSTLEAFESLLKGYNKNIFLIQEVRNLKDAPEVKSNNPRTLNHFQYSSTSTYVNSYAALSKRMERQLQSDLLHQNPDIRMCTGNKLDMLLIDGLISSIRTQIASTAHLWNSMSAHLQTFLGKDNNSRLLKENKVFLAKEFHIYPAITVLRHLQRQYNFHEKP